LTDIIFILEGSSDIKGERMINWKKWERLAQVITGVGQYQATAYVKLTLNPQMYKSLLQIEESVEMQPESELYALSLEREPRITQQTTNSEKSNYL
jgi:hypothetical protein